MAPSSPAAAHPPKTSEEAEALLVEHLPLLERIVAFVGRRHGMLGDAIEEFRSYVHLKLVENGYGLLLKFRGDSAFTTYLTAVVHTLSRDFRNERWGKWRPTVVARRLGETAVRLEQLLYRDERPLAEAIEILTRNFGEQRSPQELAALAAQLPERPQRRNLGEEVLRQLPAAADPEQPLRDAERAATLHRAQAALEVALQAVPDEDRLLLELHYRQGMALSRVARVLGVEQRSLYSRKDKCLRVLRQSLHEAGLDGAAVLDSLGWHGGEVQVDFQRMAGSSERGRMARGGYGP